MRNLVVLSGAGVSAESGLKTFRDGDGLWMGYDMQRVASPEGWEKDPALVLDFYNKRREEVARSLPNEAHRIIAALEKYFYVTVITQNIDDLHERAGSTNVIHLHGEIFKMRSVINETILYPTKGAIQLGEKAPDGYQFRPHVVWFGEPVPMIEKAAAILPSAAIFIVVGTSLQVYPAAGLIHLLAPGIPKYIIDNNPPFIREADRFTVIKKTATEGMREVQRILTMQ